MPEILSIRSEHSLATNWDSPEMLAAVEEQRYPVQRALGKIISDVFNQYVPPGSSILEVGTGQGYLRDLVPATFHKNYVSSDYNAGNLLAGQKRRELQALSASATQLPLPSSSIDCIVDMDAYDTLPDLKRAMDEAQRVLKSGGSYIHLQVNYPSDDTVWVDHPDKVFFPALKDESERRSSMVGVSRADLEEGLRAQVNINPAFRKVIQSFLDNPIREYVAVETLPKSAEFIEMIHKILDTISVDKLYIPSLPDYFKHKLENAAEDAGLDTEESQFRGTSLVLPRSKHHNVYPQFNQFQIQNGAAVFSKNPVLMESGSTNIIEKASMLVFVARKTA